MSESKQLSLFGSPAEPADPASGSRPPRGAGGAALPAAPDALSAPELPGPESRLAEAVLAFDRHLLRRAKTENTRRAFASDLRLLERHLGESRSIADIEREDLESFLSWLLEGRGRPCSPKTYARRLTTLKVFFAWLTEAGSIPEDPSAAIPHRRAVAALPRALDDEEVADLLDAARARFETEPADPRPLLMVRLLLDTGLKKGELVRLKLDDLGLEVSPPTLLVRYDSPRWANKERRVAFNPASLALLEAYRSRYRPAERLFECTARNLEYVLSDLLRAAGLPDEIGFEALRWTSALRAWRAGVDPERLRERLGLSPITWAETRRKIELLADGMGPAPVDAYYPRG